MSYSCTCLPRKIGISTYFQFFICSRSLLILFQWCLSYLILLDNFSKELNVLGSKFQEKNKRGGRGIYSVPSAYNRYLKVQMNNILWVHNIVTWILIYIKEILQKKTNYNLWLQLIESKDGILQIMLKYEIQKNPKNRLM